MLNVEVKPVLANIPIKRYMHSNTLKEGLEVYLAGQGTWTIKQVMLDDFDCIVLVNTKREVQIVKSQHFETKGVAIVTKCVLLSELKSILGVEQLTIFENE